jgi:hypothetical protein
MAWAHTLLNTTLSPVDPKPDWSDGVASELTATKKKTDDWLHKEFPDIAATLQQTLISYANLFDSAADELVPLVVGKNPTALRYERLARTPRMLTHEYSRCSRANSRMFWLSLSC